MCQVLTTIEEETEEGWEEDGKRGGKRERRES